MVEKQEFSNGVWSNPVIPSIPHIVSGVELVEYCLSNRDDNSWKFLYEPIDDIPSPYAKDQNFDFRIIKEEKWNPVVVPASLIMQGYDICNNIEYYYKRKVTIPKDFCGKRIILRFEGVYSNARIWINNQFIRAHVGGFTVWDCDITDYVKEDTITLVVGISDIDGDNAGIWNPNGERICDCSWASSYAHNNIGGILRDVILYVLPEDYIARTYINTKLFDSNNEASFIVDLSVCTKTSDVMVKLELLDHENKVCQKESYPILDIYKYHDACGSQGKEKESQELCFYGTRISLNVSRPRLWTAEHPNLYTLKISLWQQDILLQENIHKVGCREIIYGGRNGTDKNKVYVNGGEIKLRGVCRHDISFDYGRSISKEEICKEIMAYKRNHVNFVRTSHYPVSDYYLQVCDELGMYVEQENAVCFQGANSNGIYCAAENFIVSFSEMVESSRNHPSIIIWSLGNESGFEDTAGFRMEYDYIRGTDLTRPVIFSYPDTVQSEPMPYDIYSMHYNDVTGNVGKADMPVLHDEFAHVCCYNLEDLAVDNYVRVLWGESIFKGFENIFQSDGALGCAIWGGIDDVFYLPENTSETHQKHSEGKAAGYGEWGAILDVFKREKPEAYLTKKAFSPIRIRLEQCKFENECVLFLENWFDHTNLNEVNIICMNEMGKTIYSGRIEESILPHHSGFICLKEIDSCCEDVTICFYKDEMEIERCIISSTKKEETSNQVVSCFKQEETVDEIRLIGENFVWVVRKEDGMILLEKKGYCIAKGPMFFVKGHTLVRNHIDLIEMKIEEKRAILCIKESYDHGLSVAKQFVFAGEHVDTSITIENANLVLTDKDAFGVQYEIIDEVDYVEWNRNGYHDYYPENHIGRNTGRAYSKRRNCERFPDQYGMKPDWGYEEDMSNYFLFPKEAREQGLVTNDFKTTRANIREYSICTNKEDSFKIKTNMEHMNAFLEKSKKDTGEINQMLNLTVGSYYPSLGWGNYLGERIKLSDEAVITFCISM